jgi:hypothetical protein
VTINDKCNVRINDLTWPNSGASCFCQQTVRLIPQESRFNVVKNILKNCSHTESLRPKLAYMAFAFSLIDVIAEINIQKVRRFIPEILST